MSYKGKNFLDVLPDRDNISFNALRTKAFQINKDNYSEKEINDAKVRLDHGIAILDEEIHLNCYWVAMGLKHKAKLVRFFNEYKSALNKLKSKDIAIIDWGCGQGLATSVFLDWLRKEGCDLGLNVKKVRLVEVSEKALERAGKIASSYLNENGGVKTVLWKVGKGITVDSLDLSPGFTLIHLFSNILDVDGVDVKMLSNVVLNLKKMGDAIVYCVSPKCFGSENVYLFYSLLGSPDSYSYDGCIEYSTSYGTGIATCVGKAFKLSGENIKVVNPYRRMLDFGYLSDVFWNKRKSISLKYEYKLLESGTHVNNSPLLKTPFLSILNNLVVRGTPSVAPLYVEEALSRILSLSEYCEHKNGSIGYKFSTNVDESIIESIIPAGPIPQCKSRIEKTVLLQALIPVMVARVQYAILQAMMTRDLQDVEGRPIRIIVIERDVPCAKLAVLALKDVSARLSNLIGKKSKTVKFAFELDIVSKTDFFDEVYDKEEELRLEKVPTVGNKNRYDIAIDVAFFNVNSKSEEMERIGKAASYAVRITSVDADELDYETAPFTICTAENIEYDNILEYYQNDKYSELPSCDELRYFLKEIFRKKDFRPGQLPIINRALQNKSVIGLLPTGGGKSLTYQLVSMLQPGLVLIVDPLNSLMCDQVRSLRGIGIDYCNYVNSSLTAGDGDNAYLQIYDRIMEGRAKFIFVAPERMQMIDFRSFLLEMKCNGMYFSYGVIDEVHCVSEWGHDFRSSYLHLGRNIHDYVKPKDNQYVPLIGLTATASFDVLSDVQRDLSGRMQSGLDESSVVRYENTNRIELQYRVREIDAMGATDHWADKLIKKANLPSVMRLYDEIFKDLNSDEVIENIKNRFLARENITEGINPELYNRVRNLDIGIVTSIQDWLNAENGKYKQGLLVFCPHNGMQNGKGGAIGVRECHGKVQENFPNANCVWYAGEVAKANEAEKWINQDKYIGDRAGVMVATKGFGLGIDKSNIRGVIEINHPMSLEGFVQEAGRAGRDGKMAIAVIMFSSNHNYDYDVQKYLYDRSFIGCNEEKDVAKRIYLELFWSKLNGDEKIRLADFLNDGADKKCEYLVCEYGDEKTAKILYRFTCLGLVDDILVDYTNHKYKVKFIKRESSGYYETVYKYLLRYYTEKTAREKVEELKNSHEDKGEIEKCIDFMINFSYDTIAEKRKRALDDMQQFCIIGSRRDKNWLEINEELKDWIYYYFNSKYARDGYAVNGRPYSLSDDTEKGRYTDWDWSLVLKYMKVADNDMLENNSPNDNVKHLLGAVRLLRRISVSPVYSFLNVFCHLYLGVKNDNVLITECIKSLKNEGVDIIREDKWKVLDRFKKSVEEIAIGNGSDVEEIFDEVRLSCHIDSAKNLIKSLKGE